MIANVVTNKPVETIACPKCNPGAKKLGRSFLATLAPGGILCRVDLSRLEEGLGHEGFKCDNPRCGHTIKYVPKEK
jgi:hypothetical protein